MEALGLDNRRQLVHIGCMGTCTANGCDQPSIARGLCDKHRKRLARHGHLDSTRPADWGDRTSHPLYKLWHGMLRRCYDPKNNRYVNYGARGIKVNPRWHDFWTFLEDMGPRPSNRHSIERSNNLGNYEPSNCHWALPAEQARNRRSGVITAELADEIKRRSARGENAGDIARALKLTYDQVRNVIVGNSWA